MLGGSFSQSKSEKSLVLVSLVFPSHLPSFPPPDRLLPAFQRHPFGREGEDRAPSELFKAGAVRRIGALKARAVNVGAGVQKPGPAQGLFDMTLKPLVVRVLLATAKRNKQNRTKNGMPAVQKKASLSHGALPCYMSISP